jgi:MFS family permease
LHARLSVLIFLAFAVMGSWLPVFTLHLQNLNFSPSAAAWASAANAIGAMLAPLIWGQIADRWLAKERCISLCAVISGSGLWLLAGLQEPVAVILGSILLWFFLIPVIGLTGAFIFRQLEHPDREYGKIRVWGTLGWMAANWTLTAWFKYSPGLFGGETSTPADLADSMRLGGLAAFAVALFALTLPHAPPSPVSDDAHNRRSRLLRLVDAPLKALCMFRERSFVVYCACMFGFYITFPFTIQLNPLLLDHAGINRSELPLVLTIFGSVANVVDAIWPQGDDGGRCAGLDRWTGDACGRHADGAGAGRVVCGGHVHLLFRDFRAGVRQSSGDARHSRQCSRFVDLHQRHRPASGPLSRRMAAPNDGRQLQRGLSDCSDHFGCAVFSVCSGFFDAGSRGIPGGTSCA